MAVRVLPGVVALTLVILLGGAAAVPATLAPPASQELASERPWGDANALVQTLQTGSASDAVLRLAQEAGFASFVAPVHVPDAYTALAAAGIDPATLPRALVVPIGDLLTAVQIAEGLITEATVALTPMERELILSGALYDTVPVAVEAASGPERRADLVQNAPASTDAEIASITAKVDMPRIIQAGVLVLDAVDNVLPHLDMQASDDGAGPCLGAPTHTQGTTLALDLAGGSTLWNTDYTVMIDIGGDDCWVNRAGGGFSGVQVAIDVQGNDLYARDSTTSDAAAQGVANLGVGVLVDLLGSDTYQASSVRTAPQPGPVAAAARVVAQGAADTGVGVLIDAAGADTFTVHARSSGGPAAVVAQGGGGNLGVGLLVAGGAPGGATQYRATAESTLHLVFQSPNEQQYNIQGGSVAAQGGALNVGAGALVDLTGDDTYFADGRGGTGRTAAQGGSNGGVGVLADALGSDSYHAGSLGDVVLSLIVTDTVFCWTVTVTVTTAETATFAQGGTRGGVGILSEAPGTVANTMRATASSGATAHAEVALSASTFCSNTARGTATTGNAFTVAHGASDGGVAGVLLGSTGSDVYSVDSQSFATARALVKHGFKTEDATAISGSALTRSHGYTRGGVGVLVEPSGDDTYARSAGTGATEVTTIGGTVPGTSGLVNQVSEGYSNSNNNIGWLLDLDGADTYATPSAGNDMCWSQPGSAIGDLQAGRGRDLSPPYLPMPSGCP